MIACEIQAHTDTLRANLQYFDRAIASFSQYCELLNNERQKLDFANAVSVLISLMRAVKKIFLIPFLILWIPLGGCGESPTVDLYSVRNITPEVIEPGDVMVIEGEGFIEGKARIVLEGTAKPMGLKPARPFYRKLWGTAVSENRIEVPISTYQMDLLARESLRFNGVAIVSFPEIQLDSAVSLSGQSPGLQLEFRPTGGGVRIHALKLREAKKTMKVLGLLLEPNVTDDSVAVDGVIPNSFAEQTGIPVGARLISIDGFPLFSLDELAGLTLTEPHILEFVLPEGTSLKVNTNPALDTIETDEFVAIVLTSLVMGLFLAFVLPMWRGKASRRATPQRNPIPFVIGYAAAALVTVLFPAVVIAGMLNLSGTIMLVAIQLICTAILLFYSTQSLAHRLSNALGNLFSVCTVLLMGGAAGNSFGLYELTMAQSRTLFGFHVFENPLMMLSCILAISLLWPGRFPDRCTPLVHVSAWLQTISGAMLVVFFCLGGWTLPGMSQLARAGSIWLLLVSLMIFVAKTWIVLMAARQFGGASSPERRQHTSISGIYQLRWFFLPFFTSGAMYLILNPLPGDIQTAGQVISSGIFCTLFSLVLFSRIIRPQETAASPSPAETLTRVRC